MITIQGNLHCDYCLKQIEKYEQRYRVTRRLQQPEQQNEWTICHKCMPKPHQLLKP